MFNMLNSRMRRGKKSPMVCKFLSRMPSLAHSQLFLRYRLSYLLERMDFKN